MSKVVKAVTAPVRAVTSAVADVAGSAVKNLGNAVTKAADTVGTAVTNIAKNPLPALETIALVSAGVPPNIASAAVTYANGGSAKQALATYGAVTAGQAVAAEYGAPATYGTTPGSQQSAMLAAQDAGMPSVTTSTIQGATTGATGAALSGKSARDVAKAGLAGGFVSGGTQAASQSAGTQPGSLAEFGVQTIARQSLSDIVGGKSLPAGYTPTTASTPTSVTTTGAGASPGSSALAQALRTDLGAPVFGGEKDKEGRKSGWNVESLRYMGNVGEA